MTIIVGKRQKRVDEEAGILGAGLYALAGNLAVNLESSEVILATPSP